MKRTVVNTLLGVATVAVATSAFGQGSVFFNNYAATTYAPVTYGDGALVGQPVQGSQGFQAGLLYDIGGGLTALPVVETAFSDGIGTGAGFFFGPIATIPGYAGGAVTFVVQAYNGADYASSLIRGQTTFSTAIALSPAPAGDFGPNFNAFQVLTIPEPTTFALAGLGAAALLIFRRRD